MAVEIVIVDAFRNRHIPERFLSGSLPDIIQMFENQVCVCVKLIHGISYLQPYEAEDKIRTAFLDRLLIWIKDFPECKPWSVVSHGTTQLETGEFLSTLGFVFSEFKDSEHFYKNFLLLEKLSN